MRKLLAVLTGAALAALPGSALGAATHTTIGILGGNTDVGGPAVAVDPSYVVPAAGKITSFSFESIPASAGQRVDFLVFRPAGSNASGSSYTVIGRARRTLKGTGVETFRAHIHVQAGDMLGLFIPAEPQGQLFHVPVDLLVGTGVQFNEGSGVSEPTVGETVTLPLFEPSSELNESATLAVP